MSNSQEILNKLSKRKILNSKAIAVQSNQESFHKVLDIIQAVKIDKVRIKFLDKIFLNTKREFLVSLCSIFLSILRMVTHTHTQTHTHTHTHTHTRL